MRRLPAPSGRSAAPSSSGVTWCSSPPLLLALRHGPTEPGSSFVCHVCGLHLVERGRPAREEVQRLLRLRTGLGVYVRIVRPISAPELHHLERQAEISDDRVVNMLGAGLVEADVVRGRACADSSLRVDSSPTRSDRPRSYGSPPAQKAGWPPSPVRGRRGAHAPPRRRSPLPTPSASSRSTSNDTTRHQLSHHIAVIDKANATAATAASWARSPSAPAAASASAAPGLTAAM